MFVAYFWMQKALVDGNPKIPHNINYVCGPGDETWMPEWAWFVLMLFAIPLLFSLPTHLAFRKWMRPVERTA